MSHLGKTWNQSGTPGSQIFRIWQRWRFSYVICHQPFRKFSGTSFIIAVMLVLQFMESAHISEQLTQQAMTIVLMSLVMAKERVAPTKNPTISILELTAAVVAVKTSDFSQERTRTRKSTWVFLDRFKGHPWIHQQWCQKIPCLCGQPCSSYIAKHIHNTMEIHDFRRQPCWSRIQRTYGRIACIFQLVYRTKVSVAKWNTQKWYGGGYHSQWSRTKQSSSSENPSEGEQFIDWASSQIFWLERSCKGYVETNT